MMTVEIRLDDKSVDTLKKVDEIYRDAVINIGLALVSKTNYFKTLSGELNEEPQQIEDLVSIDVKDTDSKGKVQEKVEEPVKETKPKKVVSSWDGF